MMKKNFGRGLSVCMTCFGAFFGLQTAFVIIMMLVLGIGNAFSSSGFMNYAWLSTIALAAASVLMTIAMFCFHWVRKQKPAVELELNKVNWLTVLIAAVAGLAMLSVVDIGINVIPFPESWYSVFADSNDELVGRAVPLWLTLLMIGVAGPIAEEVFFRGALMNALRRDSNPVVAIIISAMLFGIAHAVPIQVCYATFFGIVMGVTFHLTKSIWPVIIIHMVNNIATTCGFSPASWLQNYHIVYMYIVLGFAMAILIGCTVWVALLEKNRAYRKIQPLNIKPAKDPYWTYLPAYVGYPAPYQAPPSQFYPQQQPVYAAPAQPQPAPQPDMAVSEV